MSTMLYAVEVPPEGSDTLLADGCAAWAAARRPQGQAGGAEAASTSYAHFMATREYSPMELSDEIRRENPDVEHPLIRTHPADGRKALWPSTGTVTEVVGMPGPEGLGPARRPGGLRAPRSASSTRHQWRAGDLLMWDNRCTLHTGTLYDDTQLRPAPCTACGPRATRRTEEALPPSMTELRQQSPYPEPVEGRGVYRACRGSRLILSLSKDEASTGHAAASSFDKLRMRPSESIAPTSGH